MDFTWLGMVPMIFGAGAASDTPRALLDQIYQPLLAGQYHNLEEFYSPRLQELTAHNLEANVVDVSGQPVDPEAPAIVSFNPFLNGETADVKDLQVTEPITRDGTAVALVSFVNAGQPAVLSISMVELQGEWKVDDIAAVGAGEKWLYSWLLQYDPFSMR
ncbi:MAG: hypothetical protein JWR39_2504 [Devosia sp.]|nr:hypothetical protein [Devosia sp.]